MRWDAFGAIMGFIALMYGIWRDWPDISTRLSRQKSQMESTPLPHSAYTPTDSNPAKLEPISGINNMVMASLFDRFFANFIDGLIVWIPYYSFIFLFIDKIKNNPVFFAYISYIIIFIWILVYNVFFWTLNGKTIGKSMLGIKVICTDGSSLTLYRAMLRLFGYTINWLTLGLGFAWILFDSNKQGFHDKIADTYVVKTSVSATLRGSS